MLTLILSLLLIMFNPADQTDRLQKLLNAGSGKTVIIPSGIFMVRALTVPPNTRVIIGRSTTIRALAMPKIDDTFVPMLLLKSGVKLEGGGLLDGNRTVRTHGQVIRIREADNVTVSNLRIQGSAEQGIQAEVAHNLIIRNVTVTNCGAKGVKQYQGINLLFSKKCLIEGCRVDNVQHGIQWWGDQLFGWCEDIRIINCRVKRAEGGIWGSLGRQVLVTRCVVENCTDVGIDFEGSQQSTAADNTVRNCKNYGLATFFASENITFRNNRVEQDASNGHGIGLCGVGISRNITFSGGSITVKGTNSCGLLTVGPNIAENVRVENVRIIAQGKEGIPVRILENNNFQIVNNPLIGGKHRWGISLEGACDCRVEGNTIVHQGSDLSEPGEGGGVFVFFRSAQYPAKRNQISLNAIQGYTTGLNDDCWGDNNSGNVFSQNTTPNLYHRGDENAWGGKATGNRTTLKANTPIRMAPVKAAPK